MALGMHGKLNKIRDSKARLRWLMGLPERFCWVCGRAFDGFAHAMNVHHIIGASGRSDEPCNFFLAAQACHMAIHGERPVVNGKALEKVSLAEVLRLKKKHDPDNFDPERLRQLRGQALPDWE